MKTKQLTVVGPTDRDKFERQLSNEGIGGAVSDLPKGDCQLRRHSKVYPLPDCFKCRTKMNDCKALGCM